MHEFSQAYPVWFCDIWGVVHNGVRHFPEAAGALQRHRRGGGTVILVTNAPRLSGNVELQLSKLRVPRDAYDVIVTSGDVTRSLIGAFAGQGVYHLGPERDLGLFNGLDVRRVPLAEAAGVVCTGLFDDTREGPEDYAATFELMRARNLTMVCANPDKIVRRGDHIIYCSGALAERYDALGGRVEMAGKPYAPIYGLAAASARAIRGSDARTLCIGDGPETDIKGAADNGYDALLIAGGIAEAHKSPDEIEAEVRAAVPGARIIATLEGLAWPA